MIIWCTRPVPTKASSSYEGTQGPSPLLKGSTGRAGAPLHRKQTCLFLEEIRSLFLLTVCCLESFAGRLPKTCVAEWNAAKTSGSSLDEFFRDSEFLFNCNDFKTWNIWCVHKVKYLSQQKAFQNNCNTCKLLVSIQMYMFNSPEENNAQVQIPPRCWISSLIVDQPERQVVCPLHLSHGWKFAKSWCWILPHLLLEVRNHLKMLNLTISRRRRFSSHYFRYSCLLGLLYFCNMNFYILVISNF